MDVVANYRAIEEAVGVFFSHESDKGKVPADDDEGHNRGSKKNNNNNKKVRQNKRKALSPQSSIRSLEAPRGGCLRQDA